MAKKTQNAEETIVDVKEVYSKTERMVEENKNTIFIIAGILIVLFAGYYAVTRLYLFPRSEEGMSLMWKAEYWFEIDSLQKALDGDDVYFGFEYVADEYSGTDAGRLASYYCGTIYMQLGNYEQAISYLKSASLSDNVAGAVAKGTIGDAYVELGNYAEAHSWYGKAVSHSANALTAPLYLMKAALLYEDQGEFKKALANYTTIKEKFPTSKEAQGIESYIARVGG